MNTLQRSRLLDTLQLVLEAHPQGLNEHALIKALGDVGVIEVTTQTFSDTMTLFRTHFLVYNALYELKDELIRKAHWILEISAVNIKLHPYEFGHQLLSQKDPMRDYYLDLSALQETTEEELDDMLRNFWKKIDIEEEKQVTRGLSSRALKCLDLEEPITFAEIKKQYRKLAMQHHPDRGGDATKIQEINEAMEVLKAAFR
ncbi:DNA-J related domain-containing protein [Oceanospirillum beijerinckii]|uniref:DNA-J related domain-containing protein n=1 Tax=Oceanospirillum beijerinckii TaxID=64976 RepID=UPI00040A540E|nr:DNA-J related domain-containing protein [Oceanospirillum beijerinckii]MAC48454.1 molecular chaperone DnaJ [Oceanospirillum sp.]